MKFFPTTPKTHSNSSEIFSEKSLNIQELLHCKSKHHGMKPMHPFLSIAFQRHQKYDLKHPGLVDLITTKQNKLPSFIDRFPHNQIYPSNKQKNVCVKQLKSW
jgi:hypothetical protein